MNILLLQIIIVITTILQFVSINFTVEHISYCNTNMLLTIVLLDFDAHFKGLLTGNFAFNLITGFQLVASTNVVTYI